MLNFGQGTQCPLSSLTPRSPPLSTDSFQPAARTELLISFTQKSLSACSGSRSIITGCISNNRNDWNRNSYISEKIKNGTPPCNLGSCASFHLHYQSSADCVELFHKNIFRFWKIYCAICMLFILECSGVVLMDFVVVLNVCVFKGRWNWASLIP